MVMLIASAKLVVRCAVIAKTAHSFNSTRLIALTIVGLAAAQG